MGTIESVQSISLKDINSWKDKYFCSNNSCVAITGNYSDEDFLTVQNILPQINSSGNSPKQLSAIHCILKKEVSVTGIH